jgi:hypothetical protein
MKPPSGANSPPQMTAAEFAAAMKHHGFGVSGARIVDTTGRCPGISWLAVHRGRGSVDRNKTLAKVLRERDAEIARRAFHGRCVREATRSPAEPSSPPNGGTRDARHALRKGIGPSGAQRLPD